MTDARMARFDAIERRPGYRRVAQAIENDIVMGRLAVGDLLPIEGDLAGQLGVHRSTVREGLRALENAGLVRRAGAKRLVVSAPEPEAVSHANSRALSLAGVSFAQLWEVQMQIEPLCARLAATRASAAQRRALLDEVAVLHAALDDDAAVIASDLAFHAALSDAAGNPVLSMTAAPVGQLLFSATRALYCRVPQARHRLLEAHDHIAQAVAGGDPARAEAWMRRHIEDFRRGYEVAHFDLDAPIGPVAAG